MDQFTFKDFNYLTWKSRTVTPFNQCSYLWCHHLLQKLLKSKACCDKWDGIVTVSERLAHWLTCGGDCVYLWDKFVTGRGRFSKSGFHKLTILFCFGNLNNDTNLQSGQFSRSLVQSFLLKVGFNFIMQELVYCLWHFCTSFVTVFKTETVQQIWGIVNLTGQYERKK